MGWRGYLFSIIALIAGPGMIIDNLGTAKGRKAIAESGAEVEGMIVGGGSSGGRSRSYDLQVAFKPENSGVREMKFDVDSSFFKAHTSGDNITDPMVTVVYDPTDYDKSYLVGTSPSLPIWLGVLVGLGGAGGLAFCLKNRGA